MASRIGLWLSRVVFVAASMVAAPWTSAQDEVWLVSTRCASDCGGAMSYWLWDGQCQWKETDAAALAASNNAAIPTMIYVHGNRTDANEAVNEGWQVYQQISAQAAGQPMRFIIWSWPADRIHGVLQDVRAKAYRSDVDAYLLAQVVSTMSPAVRVNYIGYSFGARIITGALHMLAGGELCGHVLAQAPSRAPMRAVLLAAALDCDWLLPGHRHDRALVLTEHMLITVNCADPALKRYGAIYSLHGGPSALGYTGPAWPSMLGTEAQKLEPVDVSCIVGHTHDWNRYLWSVQSRLAWYAQVQPATAADSPSAVEQTAASTPAKAKATEASSANQGSGDAGTRSHAAKANPTEDSTAKGNQSAKEIKKAA